MSPADLNQLFKDVYKPLEACTPEEAFEQGESYGRHGFQAMVLSLLDAYLPKVDRDIYGLPSATTLLLKQIRDDIRAERWPEWQDEP